MLNKLLEWEVVVFLGVVGYDEWVELYVEFNYSQY
jgi:hypothetical protein